MIFDHNFLKQQFFHPQMKVASYLPVFKSLAFYLFSSIMNYVSGSLFLNYFRPHNSLISGGLDFLKYSLESLILFGYMYTVQ